MADDRHNQNEATGSQTRSTPSAQGRPQRPAGEEPSGPGPQATEGTGGAGSSPQPPASEGAHISQRQKSAGNLASGTPPAVERADVQKHVGQLASSPPPAAPQSRGERPQ